MKATSKVGSKISIKFTRVTSSLTNYILEPCSTTARKYFLFLIVLSEVNIPLSPL